jgi:Rhs element Vgr protein
MSNDRTIPTPAPADLPTFKIKMPDSELSSAYQVLGIDVIKMYNKVASATITVSDGDASEEDFKASNDNVFKPGTEIVIEAGYHNTNEIIFKGIIIKHAIRFRRDKASMLVIEAKDVAVRLTVGRKSAYYYDSSDSDIIEEIAKKVKGLSKDVESTQVKHKEMVQYRSSDWDFIVSRAEMNGQTVFTDNNKLVVKKPSTSGSSVLLLEHGASLLEFEAEMDARHQYTAVKSMAWSPAEQKLVESEGSDPSVTSSGNISYGDLAGVIGLDELSNMHTGFLDEDELKSWSDAQIIKSKLAKIRGRAQFQGTSVVKPGDMVELKGLGDRFNGNVLVSGVRHRISASNWTTDIQFGLSSEWFNEAPSVVEKPAAGLLPGVNGLQIGVVTKLEGDPAKEHRIQVKIPSIDTKGEGIWARIATLDAGNKRGTFFRPEKNDEVIVGFLNNDPRSAIVLGMLHSSKLAAPLETTADNDEKGLVTRSEMKLLFNDKDKSITIKTPKGKAIIIDEKAGTIVIQDENDNMMEMGSSGISIKSKKDIKLEATGDVKISGKNVSVEAKSQFKAEGKSGAEVSSSGTSVLKGTTVKIN